MTPPPLFASNGCLNPLKADCSIAFGQNNVVGDGKKEVVG